jgi:S1-C subfamily serine protease
MKDKENEVQVIVNPAMEAPPAYTEATAAPSEKKEKKPKKEKKEKKKKKKKPEPEPLEAVVVDTAPKTMETAFSRSMSNIGNICYVGPGGQWAQEMLALNAQVGTFDDEDEDVATMIAPSQLMFTTGDVELPRIPGLKHVHAVDVSLKIKPPFGMSFGGSAEGGVFVTKIKEGKVSEYNSGTDLVHQIEVGMRVGSVNGNDCYGFDKPAVVDMMKAASKGGVDVDIDFYRDPSAFEAFKAGKAAPDAAPVDAAALNSTVGMASAIKATTEMIEVNIAPPLGLGFGGDVAHGVYVTKVKPEGKGASVAGMKVGLKIVKINNVSTSGKDKPDCMDMMKATPKGQDVMLGLIDDSDSYDAYMVFKAGGEAPPSRHSSASPPAQSKAGELPVSVPPPLGCGFAGNAQYGCFISKVNPDSNASQVAGIQAGCRIIKINGTATAGLDKKACTALVKNGTGACDIEMVHDPQGFAAFNAAKDAATGGGGGGSGDGSAPTASSTLKIVASPPLGLKWAGSEKHGTFATKVKPDSSAGAHAGMKAGLWLVKVNGKDCSNADKDTCVGLMKAAGANIEMEFVDDPKRFAAFSAAAGVSGGGGGGPPSLKIVASPPLGLKWAGSTQHGTFITKVKPDSSAGAHAGMKAGLWLVKVNGKDCSNADKETAVGLMKAAGANIEMELVDDPKRFAAFSAAAAPK